MLVVTANWGIGDGTLVPAVAACHGGLPAAIHRAAIRAGMRGDGSYRPIDRLDLVLAGDTFDWLLSSGWLAAAKPWHGGAAARETAARIARQAIAAARRLLGPVLHWARHGLVAPAVVRGRPGASSVRIPVRVTLLSGDRDAAVEAVVGRRHAGRPVTVGSRWDDGRVSIRHGHEFDPACQREAAGGRRPADRQATLAESLAVDLIGPFAAAGATALGGPRLVRSLAAAGATGIPAVIAARLGPEAAHADDRHDTLVDLWRRCVDGWWHEARRTVPRCELEFDAVDAIAGWYAAAATGSPAMPAGLAGLRPRPPRGSPGLVLGHVGDPGGGSAVVCLGPRGDGREPHRPTVIACPEAGGWPRWEAILPVEAAAAVVAIRAAEPPPAHGGRIVDAA